MRTEVLCALTLSAILPATLPAQLLVADRGLLPGTPSFQPIEQAGKGFLGDSFRVAAAGEVWMIDNIRLWAAPGPAAARCSRNLGDGLDKITLLGALDNPPVPGQPECDCHALVAVSSATLQKGDSASANRDVRITAANGLWQIDFRNLRWSIPGGQDVLFSLRATDRSKAASKAACPMASNWSLATAPARAGDRLRQFNLNGGPQGFAEAGAEPVRISVQVWAHRVD